MIEVRNLVKTFRDGPLETRVLKGIDFTAADGEFIAVMGRSGAGKSTLLYQISLLDEPTSGEILINRKEAHLLSEHEKMLFRLAEFGYVFQDYALLPDLTALENCILPLLMQGKDTRQAEAVATRALEKVNLAHRCRNLPSQLSGGQMQRVAIARALAVDPGIILADEPTGNLDSKTGQFIMDLLSRIHREEGKTVIIVTHDLGLVRHAERVVHLKDGLVEKVEHNQQLREKSRGG